MAAWGLGFAHMMGKADTGTGTQSGQEGDVLLSAGLVCTGLW